MSGCDRFKSIIERHISGEATAAEIDSLRAHAESCAECRRVVELHEDLTEAAFEIPEPSEAGFQAMRASVLRHVRRDPRRDTARAASRPGFWRGMWSLPAAKPAFAFVFAAALLAGGFFLGKASVSPAAYDENLLVQEISRQAEAERGLAGYWDSPFAYSNVIARPKEDGGVWLSFDVTRHIDLDTIVQSPLVREVTLHAILDSPTMASRFEALSLARESSDPKLREVLVFTLLNDPSLPVRLSALDILKQYAADPAVRDALLTSVGQDPSVHVRFLALECLAAQHVDPDVILRAAGDTSDETARAVIERAAQLTDQL